MQLSASAIDDFRPPANAFQMRMHYSIYITNLLAAIDLVKDRCGPSVLEDLKEMLQYKDFSGRDVLGYIRELRNGVVHRGLDPTAGGLVVNGVAYAIAPSTVKNKEGNRSYNSPTNLLRELFIHCETCAKPLIERYLKPYIESVSVECPEEILETTRALLDTNPHVPDFVKRLAGSTINYEMLIQARDHQIERLKILIGSPAGWQT